MNPRVSWQVRGADFSRIEGDYSNVEQCPPGVYNINYADMRGWWLTRYADNFTFDYKVYGLQSDFIDYAIKTYENTKGNLGILFNGTKGAGKTVSAKILCNRLNLPVVIVKNMGQLNASMIEYIASFNFDCILFFDEFEKNFNDEDPVPLTLMDSVYNSKWRKVFLLTTNNLRVNENLIDRPSRIKYIKEFNNLDYQIVKEYLADNLKDKSKESDVLDFIDTLTISTVDILKFVISEINIHGYEEFRKAKEFLNVSTKSYHYSVVKGYIYEENLADLQSQYNGTKVVDIFLKQVGYKLNPSSKKTIPESIQLKREEGKKLTKKETEIVMEVQKQNRRDFMGFSYSYVDDCDKPFKSMKVGETFNQDEEIIAIDTKKCYIVTKDENCLYFYYIENPDSKPSLYKNTGTTAVNYAYNL